MIYTSQQCPGDINMYRKKIHQGFLKNKDINDPSKIEECIKRGEYIIKEMEALIQLKKFRTLKKRYYNHDNDIFEEFSKRFES